MSTRDYSDSESETEAALLGGGGTRAASGLSSPSREPPVSSSGGARKITLRQSLSHHDAESSASASASGAREREYDSDHELEAAASSPPPPSIRLKFNTGSMKHARSSAMYSDSDESDDGDGAGRGAQDSAPPSATGTPRKRTRSPPAKKARKSRASVPSVPAPVPASLPRLSAQGRKAYNWLTPSADGASHTGPPDRLDRHPAPAASAASPSTSNAPPAPPSTTTSAPTSASLEDKPLLDDHEMDSGLDSAPPSEKKKAPRRKAGELGPGKNWRKGIRKGDPLPWKDGGVSRSSPLATPTRPSVSRDASPEPFDSMLLATATASVKEKRERDRERERQRELERERERESYYDAPSTTFLLADAKAMGIPVFANPIGPPKLVLGNFPKVTTSFAQFDNKPFRKEKPRDWEFAERSVTGIGGAVLKFKTWRPGPQSDLGRVLAAQREAEALAKQRKKEERAALEATPERPSLNQTPSSDNVNEGVEGDAASAAAGAGGDNASEAGGEDESTAGSVRESPTPRGRGAASKRGRPRKSKLANEIFIDNDDSAPGSARASAELETKV